MAQPNEVLHVHNLSVSYGRNPVLWSVDFKIPAGGSFVGIVGPNGAGKSTLLKACVGLLKPSQGHVKFFGDRDLAKIRSRVAYLPQRESVDWNFPISVSEVVAMGFLARGKFKPSDPKSELERCLDSVSLLKYADRQIADLSGGQQQRVFIARALAQNADLFFLDEPFAAVDVATEKLIAGVLKDLVAQGKTVIAVMHDLFSVFENVDRLLLLNTRLVAAGPKNEVFKPEHLQAAYGGQLEMLSKVMHLFSQKE